LSRGCMEVAHMRVDACWSKFQELNFRKRWFSRSLTPAERRIWRELRCFLEAWTTGVDLDPELDTREWMRVPACFPVRVRVGDRVEYELISILGERGCFVHTAELLEVGTDLTLDVKASIDLQQLSLRGRVVWKHAGRRMSERGMGIQFVDLSEEHKAVLYQLVDQLVEKMVAYDSGPRAERPEPTSP
jgi:Tfp pilus assembly protein PilZ